MRGWGYLAAIVLGSYCLSGAQAGFRDDMFACRGLVKSDPDGSIRACRAAIGMAERAPELLKEPNRADLWFQMAMAHETKNDRMGAIAALDAAIGVYSADRRFAYRRAQNWQALGECAKAIPDYTRAIQQQQNPLPGYGTDKGMLFSAYMGRGACHEKLNNPHDALKNYDLALAVFPGAEQALAAKRQIAKPNSRIGGGPPATPLAAASAAPARIAVPLSMPRRAALIIGNTDYLYTNRLPNAANDAADVAAALKAKGYAIYGYPRINMHREEMFESLDAFAKVAATADIALVWYAGHGQQMSDPGEPLRNWLIPVDFKGGMGLDRGAIPLTKLLGAAQPAKTLRVVVVDACRNTTLETAQRGPRGFRPEPRAEMVVVYSTSADSVADDGDPKERNSPFAAAFLETFKSHGQVDVRQFFGGVSEGVRRRTQTSEAPQQPELMLKLNTMETLALAP